MTRLYACTKCGEQKPFEGYYRARRERSGRQSECIECLRARRGNTPRMAPPTCLEDLYARSVLNPETGCREWQGPRDNGYGKASMGGGGKGQRQVHRLAYEFAHGAIPSGHQIHHVCRSRACVEVSHLQVLTGSAHALLHNLGADIDTCRKGHTGDWYVTPAGHRRCRECVRIRRRTASHMRRLFGAGSSVRYAA